VIVFEYEWSMNLSWTPDVNSSRDISTAGNQILERQTCFQCHGSLRKKQSPPVLLSLLEGRVLVIWNDDSDRCQTHTYQ
jgi:hypothetical protein